MQNWNLKAPKVSADMTGASNVTVERRNKRSFDSMVPELPAIKCFDLIIGNGAC